MTGIITQSDSEWFGESAGLMLANPEPIDPIPAAGALGYFEWAPAGVLAAPTKWMRNWGTADADTQTDDLFPDAPIAFSTPPKRPW